jgi:hypothetical protein
MSFKRLFFGIGRYPDSLNKTVCLGVGPILFRASRDRFYGHWRMELTVEIPMPLGVCSSLSLYFAKDNVD